MIKNITLFLFSLMFFTAKAQIQQGGIPYSTLHNLSSSSAKMITFPSIDLEKLAMEDAIYDLQKDIPYRFGFNFEGNYSTKNSGEWTNLPNGDRLWRATFYSEGAQSLNFLLENYNLAEGASIFFYNADKSVVIGSFNHKNNRAHKNLSTMPLAGSAITIEFYEPKIAKDKSTFEVTRVTHGYRSIKIPTKAVNDSGNCNNNVICAVGDDWRDQIKSVGIIVVNGNGSCTGSLINNTCQDKKPLFLTANHCTGSDVTTWNIGFNWESATCNTNSGYNSNVYESINVLTMRAQNAGSDFALLELVQTPPANFNLFFAGWDRSGDFPTSQVGIHHPSGDLKKISFDNDAAIHGTFSGKPCWRVIDWEDGTTEGGSSGSPLFDQNKRIIGQLYGGGASCTNSNSSDYYGRLDVSWDGGTSQSDELKSWLDPIGLEPMTLNGLDASVLISDDVVIEYLNQPSIQNCGTTIAQDILLTNNGANTATQISFIYGLDDNILTYNWTGSLTTGQSVTISFDDFVLCNGFYDYTLEIIEYNGANDLILCNNTDNFSFEVVNGSKLEVEVKTNANGDESSFEIYNNDNLIIYSENDFDDNTVHNFEYCLPLGNYYFKMKDSGSNGLTPTFFFDVGYYSLTLDGVEIQNNDAFGDEEITNITSVGNGLRANFLVPEGSVELSTTFYSNSVGSIDTYEWEAPDATPSYGSGIQFTTVFNTVGSHKVKLTIQNNSNCSIIEKTIAVSPNTGIENPLAFYNISIYPNPADDFINVTINNTDEVTINIKNTIGQDVYNGKLYNTINTISTKNFSKGVYYMEFSSEKGKFIKKVILK